MRRKQEFQQKKLEQQQKSDATTDLEATSQQVDTFKCEQCENTFETEKGLKVHIGRKHKDPKPLSSPERIRGSSLETSLCVSPDKVTERVEEGGERDEEEDKVKTDNVYGSGNCPCCGEVRSLDVKSLMTHQCPEGTEITCRQCGKDFKTNWDRASHIGQEQVQSTILLLKPYCIQLSCFTLVQLSCSPYVIQLSCHTTHHCLTRQG